MKVPSNIEISTNGIRLAAGYKDNLPAESLLDVAFEGDLTIRIDGEIVFCDEMMNVYEFASAVCRYLSMGRGDFSFTSVDAEESPLIRFALEKDGRMAFESPWRMGGGFVQHAAFLEEAARYVEHVNDILGVYDVRSCPL